MGSGASRARKNGDGRGAGVAVIEDDNAMAGEARGAGGPSLRLEPKA